MTTVLPAANAYQFALGKQTNGTTPLGTAAYAVPVFDSDIKPVYDLAEVVVTDASSIEGDKYKKPTHWEGTVTVPALGASLGTFIQGLWPTDTPAGTAPTTHTFSGLGGTQSFYNAFDQFTNVGTASAASYANGIATEITFACDQDGGPLKVTWTGLGSTPSHPAAGYTVTTSDTVSNGYFSMQLSGSTIEIDNDTPDVNPSSSVTNVENVSVTVSRNAEVVPTADSITVSNIAQGKVTTTGSLSFIYNSWEEWNASYFGSVTGTSASSTIVYGALDLTFKHSVQSTWQFELYCPKVGFKVTSRQPDASGGVLKLPVELVFAAPASGDRCQPILKNGVTTAYSA